ncbi:class E sortase [Modestobacter sp. NPDC049651]|uniref:class E sortase n=1 Tax=unclassified Modestobacter TaxID=2643866 RepID=UPI0033FC5B04
MTLSGDTMPIDMAGAPGPRRTAGPPRRTAGDVVRTGVRGFGQLLVTLGLVLLLFVVYELYVTDFLSGREQHALADDLRTSWDDSTVNAAPGTAGVAEPEIGAGVAFLHIPRLGEEWNRAVVQGTGQEELEQGPGHYVGTAMPGQPGNVGIAGHRVGRGSPFLDLDKMRPGDAIVLETADAWFTYRVLGDAATGNFDTDPSGIPGQQIVTPSNVDVISPTPGQPADAAASGSYLTITTCHPKYSARQRLVVHARLDGAPLSKADSPDGPPALDGR